LIIAPCTGNTLAKLSQGITDTPVCMAAKAHLRCDRPLLIALASNDALSANLKNIALLLNRKNIYFVPMKQDDYINKPNSIVADFGYIPDTVREVLKHEPPTDDKVIDYVNKVYDDTFFYDPSMKKCKAAMTGILLNTVDCTPGVQGYRILGSSICWYSAR
jgi:hypothetical protein